MVVYQDIDQVMVTVATALFDVGRVDVVKVYVIKPVGSGGVSKNDKKKKDKQGKRAPFAPEEATQPEVVLIAQRTAHNVSGLLFQWLYIDQNLGVMIKTLVDPVVFHVDAMTGADVRTRVVKLSKACETCCKAWMSFKASWWTDSFCKMRQAWW